MCRHARDAPPASRRASPLSPSEAPGAGAGHTTSPSMTERPPTGNDRDAGGHSRSPRARRLTRAAALGATLGALLAVLGGAVFGRVAADADTQRGDLGFDTGIYPGDGAMRAWRDASPYAWVGYYLRSPCRRDSSWVGTRARLARQGWGFAVVYVGRQAWAHDAAAHEAAGRAGASPVTAAASTLTTEGCTAASLSAARGHTDADAAIAGARREGFPRGTTVFLDVERMEQVPEAMRDYYRAWVRRVAADGSYRPGLYVHARNAVTVAADVATVHPTTAAPASDAPAPETGVALWVAAPRSLRDAAAAETTLARLRPAVRQVTLDTVETWGGVRVTVDVNVAASAAAAAIPRQPAPRTTEAPAPPAPPTEHAGADDARPPDRHSVRQPRPHAHAASPTRR